MRSLIQIVLFLWFVFLATVVVAEDTECCAELRKELQVLKVQQDTLLKNLRQDEVVEKKSFSTLESLMNMLVNKFPELKEIQKKLNLDR